MNQFVSSKHAKTLQKHVAVGHGTLYHPMDVHPSDAQQVLSLPSFAALVQHARR